ncbi:nucleoside deaminase [Fusibacter paucivorans]|uniref:tRNA-specific adenosine deaminase n=1 Tax=Fusibacter paucivorans TaxID=76009 RepID=A0ABS5PMY3_9FIRM|nr:nucleoside deaminase [Fusibacter paucivorans]MBS7526540.1 nucleoside deaminase [Fusibacter paucivorans]
MCKSENETFMFAALEEAEKALHYGEVPIGAVIVKSGRIIARAHNTRETSEDVLGHAEINAIRKASEILGGWRLTDCDIYVTIEPCPMCTGALYQARIRKIYYGAPDLKSGACQSVMRFFDVKGLNHYCDVESGLLEIRCIQLLKDFFNKRRR